MPKQIHKIQEFHGGLNNSSDARDISDAELSDIQDAVVSDLGKIRNMGGTTAHVAAVGVGNNTRPYVTIKPGYGLFAFSHDRTGAELGTGTVGIEQQTDYLLIADADIHANIWMYNFTEDRWMAPINMGNSPGMKTVFYIVDGVIRISDGNFGNNNANKWYGYIKRTLFKNIEPSIPLNQWYLSSAKSEAPRASSFQNDVDFTTLYGNTNSIDGSTIFLNTIGITRDSLASGSGDGALANVSKATVYFDYGVPEDGINVSIKVTIGTAAHVVTPPDTEDSGYGNSGTVFRYDQDAAEVFERKNQITVVEGVKEAGSYSGSHTFYFNTANTTTADTGDDDHWGGDDGNTEYFGAHAMINNLSSFNFTKLEVTASDTVPDLSASLDDNNVYFMTDWISSVGVGWCDGTTAGSYMFGVSFIYDEKQESQITPLTQHNNSTITTVTAAATTATQSPS